MITYQSLLEDEDAVVWIPPRVSRGSWSDPQSPFSLLSSSDRALPGGASAAVSACVAAARGLASHEGDFPAYASEVLPTAICDLLGASFGAREVLRFMRDSDDERVPAVVNLLLPLSRLVEEQTKGIAFHFRDRDALASNTLKMSRMFFDMLLTAIHRLCAVLADLSSGGRNPMGRPFRCDEFVFLMLEEEANSVFVDCFGQASPSGSLLSVHLVDSLFRTVGRVSKTPFEKNVTFPTVAAILAGDGSLLSQWFSVVLTGVRSVIGERCGQTLPPQWRRLFLEAAFNLCGPSAGLREACTRLQQAGSHLLPLLELTHGPTRILLIRHADCFYRDATVILAEYLTEAARSVEDADVSVLSLAKDALTAVTNFQHVLRLLSELQATAFATSSVEGCAAISGCREVASQALQMVLTIASKRLLLIFHEVVDGDPVALCDVDAQLGHLSKTCEGSWRLLAEATSGALRCEWEDSVLKGLRDSIEGEGCTVLLSLFP